MVRLGVLVVYLVSEDTEWILAKHLEHLAQTVPSMEFKVYAAANRLPAKYLSLLRTHSFVKIVDLPATDFRRAAEHGTYLDMLASRALADGCDYLCTFDMDSWPIRNDWIGVALDKITETGAAAVAVLRAENGDTVLPHPSFCFIEASLFRDQDCRFWVVKEDMSEPFHAFLSESGQRPDTGIAVAYCLQKKGLKWTPLTRSNKRDYHYLMGGIYGGLIFHLGAAGRTRRIFARDRPTWVTCATMKLRSLPWLWRYELAISRALRWPIETWICYRNDRAFNAIGRRLLADEQVFYQELLEPDRKRV